MVESVGDEAGDGRRDTVAREVRAHPLRRRGLRERQRSGAGVLRVEPILEERDRWQTVRVDGTGECRSGATDGRRGSGGNGSWRRLCIESRSHCCVGVHGDLTRGRPHAPSAAPSRKPRSGRRSRRQRDDGSDGVGMRAGRGARDRAGAVGDDAAPGSRRERHGQGREQLGELGDGPRTVAGDVDAVRPGRDGQSGR